MNQIDTEKKVGLGEAVVLRLCGSLPPGTRLYYDRFFSTLNLLDCLSEKGMFGTGTIQKNRIPRAAREKIDERSFLKRPRGHSVTIVRQHEPVVAVTTWLDNKIIFMASNHEGIQEKDECRRWSKKDRQYINVERPAVVRNYNKNMGGIDLCDQMIAYYRMGAKTKKWTVRTIFHFIDLACANSWREYVLDAKREGRATKNVRKYLEFKMDIAEYLLHSTEQEEDSSESECDLIRNKVVPLPHPAKRKCISQWSLIALSVS